MVIGITGGFGCGKSTVLALFQQFGAEVYSADRICHEIYEAKDEDLLCKLKNYFGAEAVLSDGTVNRKFIASKVFSDQCAMDFLNSILKEPLKKRLLDIIKEADPDSITAVEIPLLFEGNYENSVDKVIAVYAPDCVREKFLAKRGFNSNDMQKRDAAQMPLAEKIQKADFVIVNSSTEDFLKEQFIRIWNILTR